MHYHLKQKIFRTKKWYNTFHVSNISCNTIPPSPDSFLYYFFNSKSMNSVENNKIKNSSMQTPVILNTILRWHIKYLLYYYVDVRSNSKMAHQISPLLLCLCQVHLLSIIFLMEKAHGKQKIKFKPDNILRLSTI